MRVQSSKPLKNGGFLHKDTGLAIPYVPISKPEPVVNIDFQAKWQRWVKTTTTDQLKSLANALRIDVMALYLIGVAYSTAEQAWGFPMHNSEGSVIGIRLRNMDGHKWALKGSKQGIFLSREPMQPLVLICEGPTDTAAAVSLGYSVIGRPSCLGCEDIILKTIERNKVSRVVIVSDNDTPGMRGADKLQKMLQVPSCIFVPPCKDIREFVGIGGDRETLETMLKDLVWTKPS